MGIKWNYEWGMSSGKNADAFIENCENKGTTMPKFMVNMAFIIAKEFVKQSKE